MSIEHGFYKARTADGILRAVGADPRVRNLLITLFEQDRDLARMINELTIMIVQTGKMVEQMVQVGDALKGKLSALNEGQLDKIRKTLPHGVHVGSEKIGDNEND